MLRARRPGRAALGEPDPLGHPHALHHPRRPCDTCSQVGRGLPEPEALAPALGVRDAVPHARCDPHAVSRPQAVPDALSIRVGDSLRVSNDDTSDHDFAVRALGVSSGNMVPGTSFTYRFTKAGTFYFVCEQHEGAGMTGSVTVRP